MSEMRPEGGIPGLCHSGTIEWEGEHLQGSARPKGEGLRTGTTTALAIIISSAEDLSSNTQQWLMASHTMPRAYAGSLSPLRASPFLCSVTLQSHGFSSAKAQQGNLGESIVAGVAPKQQKVGTCHTDPLHCPAEGLF